MKKQPGIKIYFFALMCFCAVVSNAQTATIKIDISRVTGTIDPRIYGVFMEPIHLNGKRVGLPDSVDFNTLYGTLYDPASPLADENGFRKDYIEAMRELKVTNMRWPGGNYLMGYNWEDGIGPKDKRPTRINLAWGGTDNNHVGTDEWIQLNKSIGTENVICVNLGLGTINDALRWVEYCNYKKGTYYADLRAKYGHAEPYNVKIWDLGNEVDGLPWELGHKPAEDYVKMAREAAKGMKAVDSSIQLVASGSSYYEPTGQWVDWNRKVLGGLGDMITYISIHRYWENSPDYYSFMGQSAADFEEKINVTAGQIAVARVQNKLSKPIYISVDEWGSFGRNFLSVLSTVQCLNSFIRHADIVKMADFTTLTSLLSVDPVKGTFKSPLFYAFKLFSNNCRGNAVDAYVECDTFNSGKLTGIPFLDVTAVYSKDDNTVFINVVNRHKDKAIAADVSGFTPFAATGVASVLTSKNLSEPFAFDNNKQYEPVTETVQTNGNKLNYTFLPHSFTQIKIGIKAKQH